MKAYHKSFTLENMLVDAVTVLKAGGYTREMATKMFNDAFDANTADVKERAAERNVE
jgi:hypothetical protein